MNHSILFKSFQAALLMLLFNLSFIPLQAQKQNSSGTRSNTDNGENRKKTSNEEIPEPNQLFFYEVEPAHVNLDSLKPLIGYPREATDKNIEGKVVLRILSDTAGNYVRHIVLNDCNPILLSAVESKIKYLRFSPGIRNGKPVYCWVTVPIDFRLVR